MIQIDLELLILALVPAALTAAVFLLVRKTGFGKKPWGTQQIIIGIVFGIVTVLELKLGVRVNEYTISVRDAVPVCAGLIFGGPAGIIAGVIGSLERCLEMAFIGLNMRFVCSTISTVCAGLMAAAARKFIFEDRRATALTGFFIAATAVIIHLFVLLALYENDINLVYTALKSFSYPLIICNGLAAALGVIAVRVINHEGIFRKNEMNSSTKKLRTILLVTVACIMSISIVIRMLLNRYTISNEIAGAAMRNYALKICAVDAYLSIYLEFVVLAFFYAFMLVIMRRIVKNNILSINAKLETVIDGGIKTSSDKDSMDEIISAEKNFELYVENIADKLNEEMTLARNIQMSMMPESSTIMLELAISASVEPAKDVGGDFYDYFRIDDERMAVLMADVSGKGIGAAMFMMRAKGIIRKLAKGGYEIDEVFNRANLELCEDEGGGLFVTVWMGIINLKTGAVDYADAGHGLPLMKVPGHGFEYVDSIPEIVMAALPDRTYKVQHLQMVPGSRLYLFTDGVTEANDRDRNMYGEERLRKCLTESCSGQNGTNLIDTVKKDMADFVEEADQFDDITMLVADYLGTMEDAEVVERWFRASGDDLHDAMCFINEMLAKADCNQMNEMQIDLAFEEMFINIADYAYTDRDGDVSVEMRVQPGVAQIKLTDTGVPFNPLEREAPDLSIPVEERPVGGLGIPIVRKTMDYIHYKYVDGANVFTMKKILD